MEQRCTSTATTGGEHLQVTAKQAADSRKLPSPERNLRFGHFILSPSPPPSLSGEKFDSEIAEGDVRNILEN
ncbi:hypothetical protein Tsubulata_048362 [Turnera subulata]|uniref:Uncharacterized protein n=1 Tax=Turnera subulata TaxID=218843 RepID=A0A9Q0JKM5_9ROSI|nr:hypothetical protein Tsubulata_048362 [Turnera subulata]